MASIWAPEIDTGARLVEQDGFDAWVRETEDGGTAGHTHLKGITAAGQAFSRMDWRDCLVEGCRLSGSIAPKNHFSNVIFKNCDLSNAELTECVFSRVRFEGCKLTGASLFGGGFSNVLFRGCVAGMTSFTECTANTLVFEDCRLPEARLDGLRGKAYAFAGCDLRAANLMGTRLKGLRLDSNEIEGIAVRLEDLAGAKVTTLQAAQLARLLGVVLVD